MEKTKIVLEIDNDLKQKLVAIASDKEMSLSALVRVLIKEYLKIINIKLTFYLL